MSIKARRIFIILIVMLLALSYPIYIEISSMMVANELNTLLEDEDLSLMSFTIMGGPLFLKLKASSEYKQSRIRSYISEKSKRNFKYLELQARRMETEFEEMRGMFQ